jgi:hypothetical protein
MTWVRPSPLCLSNPSVIEIHLPSQASTSSVILSEQLIKGSLNDVDGGELGQEFPIDLTHRHVDQQQTRRYVIWTRILKVSCNKLSWDSSSAGFLTGKRGPESILLVLCDTRLMYAPDFAR